MKQALAGLREISLTAGGELRPALRTIPDYSGRVEIVKVHARCKGKKESPVINRAFKILIEHP